MSYLYFEESQSDPAWLIYDERKAEPVWCRQAGARVAASRLTMP